MRQQVYLVEHAPFLVAIAAAALLQCILYVGRYSSHASSHSMMLTSSDLESVTYRPVSSGHMAHQLGWILFVAIWVWFLSPAYALLKIILGWLQESYVFLPEGFLSRKRAAEGATLLPLFMTPAEAVQAEAVPASYGACSLALEETKKTYPIYSSQEPMILWQHLRPTGCAYNECFALWLDGFGQTEMSSHRLQKACQLVLRKYPTLRTRFFLNEQGMWTRMIVPMNDIWKHVWSETQLGCVDESAAVAMADEACHRPLDIFNGCCLRFGLLLMPSSKALFYVVQHHAVTDGQSIPLLYQELSQFFSTSKGDLNRGQDQLDVKWPKVNDTPPEVHNSALRWWRTHLRGAEGLVPKLDLPRDRSRRKEPSHAGIRVPLELPPGLAEQIIACSQAEGVTVLDFILALQSCWLCLLGGCPAVVVGVPHHGRSFENVGDDLGCFITMMALRIEPKGSFREFLHSAAATKRDGLQHANLPAMVLFEAATDFESGSREVPYQTILSYHSDRYNVSGIERLASEAFAPGVKAQVLPLAPRAAKVDVELIVARSQAGPALSMAILFAADLFSEAACHRMARQLVNVMSAAITGLQTDVARLSLMSPAEELQLDQFHGASLEPQPVMPKLLMEMAESHPTFVAVELDTGEQLSYGALWLRVRALASHLATRAGVRKDVLVPLLLERSFEMVVAVHGVMAAGGAYVPLDTEAPPLRLSSILEDIKTHNFILPGLPSLWLLTQSHIGQRIRSDESSRSLLDICNNVIHLDEFTEGIVPSWTFVPPAPESLCYSIFTSGSTGKPKGVLLQHDGLATYIKNRQLLIQLSSKDILLQKTPYTFDVSLHELMWPVVAGAKILVAKPGGHKDPSYLQQIIKHKGVTHIHFVPGMLDAFLHHLQAVGFDQGDALSLSHISCSGEALDASVCRSCLSVLPEVELHDLYGPTEATVEVTYLKCNAAIFRKQKTIGKAIRGVRCYITEPKGEPRRVPVGIHGELLLGGVQLARGYINNPKATLEAFTQDPFLPGARTYKTGDIMKWNEDGGLVYVGRKDAQIKLNGFRIELGDVEAAAAGAPKVKEAAAVVAEGKRLLVYVIPRDADSEAVLQHCRRCLPPYMVPAAVVCIDAMPRTNSGKVDRKSLPSPALAVGDADQSYIMSMVMRKINDLGLLAAMGDTEVQSQGWNSLQVMQAYSAMLRAQKEGSKQQEDRCCVDKTDACCIAPQPGQLRCVEAAHEGVAQQHHLMACIGHLWFFFMCLVLMEWVTAYWQWYQAVPAVHGRFRLEEWPFLEQMNAVGRLTGDPFFVMLASIQDMGDAAAGRTEQLMRRFVLFAVIAFVFTLGNYAVLRGPCVQLGWVDAEWAANSHRVCGVLNGAVFIYARAFFMPFAMLLSKRCFCGWIKIGVIEWPWACIAFAMFTPALVQGFDPTHRFSGDGGSVDEGIVGFIKHNADFIIELSPYYFLYPLFVGGIRFPGAISQRKSRLSPTVSSLVTCIGLAGVICILNYMHVVTYGDADGYSSRHTVWKSIVARVDPDGDWPLATLVAHNMDMYSAFLMGTLFIFAALASPVTPTVFSLLGSRVLLTYLTFPITLTAFGYYFGAPLLSIVGPWRSLLVQLGICLMLVMTVALSAQPLPEWMLGWATGSISERRDESFTSSRGKAKSCRL